MLLVQVRPIESVRRAGTTLSILKRNPRNGGFSRKPFRDFVYRGLSGNGSPMYVRASGKPLFDANGEFRGYRGTCSDVTEIMRAQETLRESERRLRSAID